MTKIAEFIGTLLPKGDWVVGRSTENTADIYFFLRGDSMPVVVMREEGIDQLLNGPVDPIAMELKGKPR